MTDKPTKDIALFTLGAAAVALRHDPSDSIAKAALDWAQSFVNHRPEKDLTNERD